MLACLFWLNTSLLADCIVYENRAYAEKAAETFWKQVEWKLQSLFDAQNAIDYNGSQGHLSYPSVQDTVKKYHDMQIDRCKL